jgi:hypothetical protein
MLDRSRARRGARRLLDRSVVMLDERVGGMPVVSVGSNRLVYRESAQRGSYFRLLTRCTECGKEFVDRRIEIRSPSDLEGVADIEPSPCPTCLRPSFPQLDAWNPGRRPRAG